MQEVMGPQVTFHPDRFVELCGDHRQADIVRATGIDQSKLSKVMRGIASLTIPEAICVAHAIGKSVDELIDGCFTVSAVGEGAEVA